MIPIPLQKTSNVCRALSSRYFDVVSLYVVTICNDDSQSQFFITSLISSTPFTMGPYESPIYINSGALVKMAEDLLFVHDQ